MKLWVALCLTDVGCALGGLGRKEVGGVPDAHGTMWEGRQSHRLDNGAQG